MLTENLFNFLTDWKAVERWRELESCRAGEFHGNVTLQNNIGFIQLFYYYSAYSMDDPLDIGSCL